VERPPAPRRFASPTLYHDGGIEHSLRLLPGLISRADCAVFPIGCISHDAMGILKRQAALRSMSSGDETAIQLG